MLHAGDDQAAKNQRNGEERAKEKMKESVRKRGRARRAKKMGGGMREKGEKKGTDRYTYDIHACGSQIRLADRGGFVGGASDN